jgi:(p)ppGpp synthase/HD superfamily hydrolase
MIDVARQFAIDAHGGQRYGRYPYVHHLDAVAAHARPFGEDAQVIAYLHDVVEDTAVESRHIEQHFGHFIACCVDILTDEPGRTRAERKRLTYAKMARVSEPLTLALVVKVADRLANVSACIDDGQAGRLRIYAKEQPVFRGAAFRPRLCDALWHDLDSAFRRGGVVFDSQAER